ncbi:MAG: T9SS type A sorting domain-containing protein, partial [Bacteroidetes bacterium]|nr:T9SS type A sorting domain-containing protein [Bacteroidota bacterium]
SVAPNPSSGIFTLYTPQINGEIQINVFDANGKLVFTQVIAGQNSLDLDLSNLASGMYSLQLIGDNKTASKQILIKH